MCGPNDQCPPGLSCHGGVCRTGNPGNDASATFPVTVTLGAPSGSWTVPLTERDSLQAALTRVYQSGAIGWTRYHVPRHELAVAGEDFAANPGIPQVRQDLRHVWSGRVHEGEIAGEDQVVFVGLRECTALAGVHL